MLIDCCYCGKKVMPQKKSRIGWVIFWVVVFWPIALVYAMSRSPVTCPICGHNVYK